MVEYIRSSPTRSDQQRSLKTIFSLSKVLYLILIYEIHSLFPPLLSNSRQSKNIRKLFTRSKDVTLQLRMK